MEYITIDEKFLWTLPCVCTWREKATLDLLPDISKAKCEGRFDLFNSWFRNKKVTKLLELVIFAYFAEDSKINVAFYNVE